MTLVHTRRRWLLAGCLALAALSAAAPLWAGELPEPTRQLLARVAELRRQGKPAEAVTLLEDAAKKAQRGTEEAGAIHFVLADVLRKDLKDEKRASSLYGQLAVVHTEGEVEIPGFGPVNLQHEALRIQDERNQAHWLYQTMDVLTRFIAHNPATGNLLAPHKGVLAILLLSILIKVALTPLTIKSFRSMRDMQKVQPLLKELQQKYKDKPQELNRRVMELYREHGVNPMSGCLPMLLQMPIIILLWRAIALYQYPLSKESFLWIDSLAMADTPLALIYAVSLLASSKLTMMPTTDPQQEQTQKMMMYMMPVMFFWLFKSYPSGFILGWLFFNILTTAQQWHLMRAHPPAVVGAGGGNPGPAPDAAAGPDAGGNGVGKSAKPAPGAGRSKPAPPSARVAKRKTGTGSYRPRR
ncbi:MAG: YidC/Oxa1 family membrane protein insertase [Armatimonadota bacterium]|nr:YidC/Oxa1 family membrane protein insertase [Armatimonadota bacterium]